MISEILAVRSSFPSAFSSLGVGSIALVGQVPFVSILRQKFPSGFDELVLSQTLKSAMPFIISLSFFFIVYCTGFVLIAMAGRFRGQHVSSDARRLVKVLSAKHDLLSKFYFEQRAIIEVLDGAGLAGAFSFFGLSIYYLSTNGFNPIVLATFLGIIAVPFLFWRESTKRTQLIDDVLSKLSETSTTP